MDYTHESWFPWYRRVTVGWRELSAAARGVLVSVEMELNPKTGEIILRRGLESLPVLIGIDWSVVEPALGELISGGRLEWHGDRFALRDPEYLTRKLATSTERVRAFRARRVCNNETVSPVSNVSDVSVTQRKGKETKGKETKGEEVVRDAPPSDEESVSGIKPHLLKYRAAYCDGIAKAKGSPFAWPPGPKSDEWADKDLGHAIATFAKSRSTGQALRGETLLGWIQAAAEDFVDHVLKAKDDPKFWSHYAPKGFVRFLNQDSQAQEARDVG